MHINACIYVGYIFSYLSIISALIDNAKNSSRVFKYLYSSSPSVSIVSPINIRNSYGSVIIFHHGFNL